jgi:putative tricarboxylic transport membrane protein
MMEKDLQKSFVIAGAVLLLLGLWIVYTSFSWKYYTSLGPGPGFFPFWIGVLISATGALMSALNLISLRKNAIQGESPSGRRLFTALRLKNVAVMALSLILATLLLKGIGFVPVIALFALFLLQIVGRWGWGKSLLLSAIVSIALFSVFRSWLHIPLPVGVLKYVGVS